MQLRSAYGVTGSKLPGFLRGVVAATAWFGVQTYIGATVLTILIAQIWPGYLLIGGGWESNNGVFEFDWSTFRTSRWRNDYRLLFSKKGRN